MAFIELHTWAESPEDKPLSKDLAEGELEHGLGVLDADSSS